jgi:hypothetical protein
VELAFDVGAGWPVLEQTVKSLIMDGYIRAFSELSRFEPLTSFRWNALPPRLTSAA